MRITGLASGMNVDDMVEKMMSAKRAPLDKLAQQKQTLEWKRDYYREVNSKLVDLRNNKIWKYRTGAEMNPYKSTVSGDEKAISVKASPNATQVDMKVEVGQLATQRSSTSTDRLGTNVSKGTTLSSLGAAAGTVKLDVTRGSKTVEIELTSADTIDSAIRKINSNNEANVTAVFDEVTGKITIKDKEYGKQDVQFSGDLKNVFKLSDTYEGGDKAQVKINGEDKEYNSNTFTVNGVEITLNAKTETGKTSVITTKTDSTKILETVKSFIADYNSVLETINKKLSEERYRDYAPLSDSQKENMKEDDIKRWTEKAQSGLLRGDEILSQVVSKMRNDIVTSSVKDSDMKLSSIGITTGAYFENGKLVLDEAGEEKLKKAIEQNPDEVLELFVGPSITTDLDKNSPNRGLFNRLYDDLAAPLESLAKRAGTSKNSTSLTDAYDTESVMGKQLTDLNQRIKDMQKKLTAMETSYYTKFSAMETAINRLNSQSSSITNLLSQ